MDHPVQSRILVKVSKHLETNLIEPHSPRWHRGKVKDLLRYQTGRAANVVLVDRGRKLERISTDRLRKMEGGWGDAVEPLAKDFTLFGLKPLAPETFVGGKSIVRNQGGNSIEKCLA